MIDSYFRSPIQDQFITPIAHLIKHKKISPSTITLAALVSGVGVAFALVSGSPLMAVLLLLFSGYCDCLDGTVARLTQCASPAGAVFDIISDRSVEVAVIIGLYLLDPPSRAGVSIAMLSSTLLCVTSFLVVGVFSANTGKKSFYYSPGLIERSEAFLFFGAMILFPIWYAALAMLFTALVLLTTVIRVYEFSRESR